MPEWRIIDSNNKLYKLDLATIQLPNHFDYLAERNPNSYLLKLITSTVTKLTADYTAAVAWQEYECETVAKWSQQEVRKF